MLLVFSSPGAGSRYGSRPGLRRKAENFAALLKLRIQMSHQVFVFDPESPLSWEEQMEKQFFAWMRVKRAEEKVQRGRDQVKHGELRRETVNTFLSAFGPEVGKMLEERIKRLRPIKSDKKFQAEVVSLLLEIYLIGIYHGAEQHEAVAEMRKKYFPKKV